MQASGDGQVVIEDEVKKAQQGDPAAFTALYERFFDQIYRYVSFKTGSPSDADDITGDVFVRMLESIHTFKWQGHPFSSWLFRIAHNLVVDYFRKKGKRRNVSLEAAAATSVSSSHSVDSQVELSLTMEEVHRAMGNLTNLQQQVISLRFAAGLSVSETARAVGKKENAVKALQHAGIKKLRHMLNPEPTAAVAVRHHGA